MKKPKVQKRTHKTCLKCGRRLTDQLSKRRGYGPVCLGKMPSIAMAQLEMQGQMRLPGIL